MPGKHTTVFPLRRYSFVAGAATLLVVLVSWVAVRAVGPAQPDRRVPLMVQPTMPLTAASPPAAAPSAAPPSAPPTSTPPTSASPTSAPPSSASPTTSKKPSPKPTTKPVPRQTTTAPPAPKDSFAAAYRVGASWDRGFIGAVDVTNKSGPARTWTVKVTFPADAGVRVGNTWNAQLTRQGDTFVFTGGPLAPGATTTLGFEASKQVRGRIEPSSCTVDGASCRVG